MFSPEILALKEKYQHNLLSLSNKYSASKKHNGEFYLEIDPIVSPYFERYSTTSFKNIFHKIDFELEKGQLNSIAVTEEMKQSLAREYFDNPKSFQNRLKNSRNGGGIFYHRVERILGKENLDTRTPLSQVFFHILHPDFNIPMCRLCHKKEVLWRGSKYGDWCSSSCARRDVSRIPEDTQKLIVIKRNKTMAKLRSDPKWRAMYSAKISQANIKRYSNVEAREKASVKMKQKILEGTFTPCITNSWTRWTTIVDGKKFRSSFEGVFWLFHVLYCGNKNIEYERLRIPYIDENDKGRIYVVDFIDHGKKEVYEIKPSSLTNKPNCILKQESLLAWCRENSYSYRMISESDLKEYILKMHSDQLFDDPYIHQFMRKYKKWF